MTTCDLAAEELSCEASVVIGPGARVFYVSPTAVYVWMSDWLPRRGLASPALLCRMPLEGRKPLKALGGS